MSRTASAQPWGQFSGPVTGDGPPSPAVWHTLARHGPSLRGPDPAPLDIRADPEALAAWTADNMDRYWRRLYVLPTRWQRILTESLRIRHTDRARPTLASAAVGWTEFAVGGEQRTLYRAPLARRRDVLAFADMMITDVRRRCARRPH